MKEYRVVDINGSQHSIKADGFDAVGSGQLVFWRLDSTAATTPQKMVYCVFAHGAWVSVLEDDESPN